jgi:3-phosphoshikimate 1-carboxyvinyltransferase
MHSVIHSHQSVTCQVSLPLSKSIINRLLAIHYFSGGEPISSLLSESSDTVAMQNLLLEISNKSKDSDTITEINVGNAGTVMRFLSAVLAVTPGKWIITGTERMQQRPVKPLTDALQSMGADMIFQNKPGYPPVLINGNPNLKGGTVKLDASISSQFISAMMMLGPALSDGIVIELLGDITSESYIRMTQALMQKAGADVSFNRNKVNVKPGGYKHFDFSSVAEPDWSAAAFWYQVAAFAEKAHIVLKGLRQESVQGDAVLPDIFAHLGVNSVFTEEGLQLSKSEQPANSEFNYDFTNCPDLAQAVIVCCAALGIRGRFTGLKTLRVKETDRIAALSNELRKLGYNVEVVGDQIGLSGNNKIKIRSGSPVVVHCYDDHRMAMSFAPLAILRNDICLDEPEVVKKSYPGFWKDMTLAGVKLVSEK